VKTKTYINTQGCPMRLIESQRIRHYFEKNNFEVVSDYNLADTIIISACSVTKFTEQKSMDEITKVLHLDKTIIITGCLSIEYGKRLQEKYQNIHYINPIELDNFDYVFPENTIKFQQIDPANDFSDNKLCKRHYLNPEFKFSPHPNIIKKYKRYKKQKTEDEIFNQEIEANNLLSEKKFIVINTGCVLKCSFCNTRLCINNLKSKSFEEVKTEYENLLFNKVCDFILISEDIGSYGLELQQNLPQLLKLLDKATGQKKVRWQLDGLNPIWSVKFEKYLLALLKYDRIYSITIPFQSGSEKILKKMNRYSDLQSIEQNIKTFRKQYNLLRLHGVFMIGFPSETDKDFQETLKFILKTDLDIVSFTYYSEFEQCDSSKIYPKVENEIIQQRYKKALKFLSKRNICVKT